MPIHCTGTARIRHHNTGVEYSIDSNDVHWEHSGTEERSMGPEQHYSAILDHPELGQLTWYLAEYPLGAENFKETDVGNHTIIEDFEYSLSNDVGNNRQGRIDELVEWFHENFEDPAENTPYSSGDGGYQWVWGGPYDAREELSDNFSDEPEDIIEAAIQIVQNDGIYDWAPKNPSENYRDIDGINEEIEANEPGIVIPEQEGSIRFTINSQGQIAVAPFRETSAEDLQEITELRASTSEAIEELLSVLAGTNAYIDLLRAVNSYAAALNNSRFSIDQLYSSGLRLENLRNALLRDSVNGTLSPMPTNIEANLNSVLQLHATIIASTNRGRELLGRSHAYLQSNVDIRRLQIETASLSQALLSNSDLFDHETREILHELNSSMTEGTHPERNTEQAITANNNLLITLAKTAGFLVVSNGLANTIPAMELTNAITGSGNTAWLALSENIPIIRDYIAVIGTDMSWLQAICNAVDSMIKKTTKAE